MPTVTIHTEMEHPLEPGKQPISPLPIARMTDQQGEVVEELNVGEKYKLEVYAEEKAITIPRPSHYGDYHYKGSARIVKKKQSGNYRAKDEASFLTRERS